MGFTMDEAAVLIVEDEALILLDLEPALAEAGFLVVGVKNAEQAIAAFDADPHKFKALISDIRLGPGQSGWGVARHLRQTSATIPVVYISGDSAVHWGAEGVPGSLMITKPFVPAQIITAVTTLLNAQPIATAEPSSNDLTS
ncbi:response regulator [Mesorhizobium sp. 131-2-1]|nr:response regulator [Mesorhizobium sp. 131-2-1]